MPPRRCPEGWKYRSIRCGAAASRGRALLRFPWRSSPPKARPHEIAEEKKASHSDEPGPSTPALLRVAACESRLFSRAGPTATARAARDLQNRTARGFLQE